MAYCPKCETDWENGTSECPVCSTELVESKELSAGWTVLGYIEDKMSADFAVETLKTYGIPAVVISKSGFFGEVGLTLNPFYSSKSAQFQISVPIDDVPEACDALDMTLGDKWQRVEGEE